MSIEILNYSPTKQLDEEYIDPTDQDIVLMIKEIPSLFKNINIQARIIKMLDRYITRQ
jgi:hypothetical protein